MVLNKGGVRGGNRARFDLIGGWRMTGSAVTRSGPRLDVRQRNKTILKGRGSGRGGSAAATESGAGGFLFQRS